MRYTDVTTAYVTPGVFTDAGAWINGLPALVAPGTPTPPRDVAEVAVLCNLVVAVEDPYTPADHRCWIEAPVYQGERDGWHDWSALSSVGYSFSVRQTGPDAYEVTVDGYGHDDPASVETVGLSDLRRRCSVEP